MLLDIQKYLSKYVSKKSAYRIVFYLYCIITFIPILLIGYYMDTLIFVFICAVLMNYIRKFTYGFHLTNSKCLIFTCCLLSIFSYFVKTVPLYIILGIGLFSMKQIYINSPLKLTIKEKDLKWHEDKILLILGILLIISTVSLLFGAYIFTRSIMCSIIMIDLTLFINKNETRG